MHTMWKGYISFGLVNIPVKLYSATEDRDIKLRTLHKDCHTPIKYEKVCPSCDKEVQNEEIIKGYEYVKGKFVILTDEELNTLKEKHEEKRVEIVYFVKLDEIDPIYFNRSYFIGPGENGSKAYALLRESLDKSGKIGIAEITIRSKQHMAIVRTYKNHLIMETMYYPDEVRNVNEVPGVPENVDINEKELNTAIMLIDQLTTTFEPGKYQDDYRTALMNLIEEKVNNNEGETAKEGPKTNVVDLMSALQASIEKTKPNKTVKPPTEEQAKAKTKTRTTRKKVSG